MTTAPRYLLTAALGAFASTVLVLAAPHAGQAPAAQPPASQQPPATPPGQPPPQQPGEIGVSLPQTGDAAPRAAVPNFLAAPPDLQAAADTIGGVLWEDLRFEREYDLIPRASYAPITPATSMETIPFDQWKE